MEQYKQLTNQKNKTMNKTELSARISIFKTKNSGGKYVIIYGIEKGYYINFFDNSSMYDLWRCDIEDIPRRDLLQMRDFAKKGTFFKAGENLPSL